MNGSLIGTASNTENIVPIINQQVAIGAYNIGDGQFGGSIDEVRIYNRALTSGDVQTLYYSNLNKYNSGNRNFITQWNNQQGLTGQNIFS